MGTPWFRRISESLDHLKEVVLCEGRTCLPDALVSESAKQVLQEDRGFALLIAPEMLTAVSDKGFETLTKVVGGRIDGHCRASSLVEPTDGLPSRRTISLRA